MKPSKGTSTSSLCNRFLVHGDDAESRVTAPHVDKDTRKSIQEKTTVCHASSSKTSGDSSLIPSMGVADVKIERTGRVANLIRHYERVITNTPVTTSTSRTKSLIKRTHFSAHTQLTSSAKTAETYPKNDIEHHTPSVIVPDASTVVEAQTIAHVGTKCVPFKEAPKQIKVVILHNQVMGTNILTPSEEAKYPPAEKTAVGRTTVVHQLQQRVWSRGEHPDNELESALEVLRRRDLTAMTTASSTLVMKTNVCEQCCWRCVEVPADMLIYNVIVQMSTQSANLLDLRNLLWSLSNLARFRRAKHPLVNCIRSKVRRDLNIHLVELLGEVLLVFSDELKPNQSQSWYVFTAAAAALWDIIVLLESTSTRGSSSWNQTLERLMYLQRHVADLYDNQFPKRHSRSSSTKTGVNPTREQTLFQYVTQARTLLDRIVKYLQS
ncbi:hypothetical protein PsorP6_011127 [Peronosclerospora sorghi]|uniref:Uncharacterized protein n=1 Tax=Peronosclerospora sorghi TaxID=230839 RepID=A0ACC0VXD5_9STRA|nr:hypothetical protein PsorP6_011127 [Peronosclerospora sorghi]